MAIIDVSGTEGAYAASIAALRTELGVNQRANSWIRIDFAMGANQNPLASFLMNQKTLYLDAFLGANGRWYNFEDSARPAALQLGIAPGHIAKIAMSGSHLKLPTSDAKCKYVTGTIKSMSDLMTYTPAQKSFNHLKLPVSFAIVCCAEAARFALAEEKMRGLLEGEAFSYLPYVDWRTCYSDWQRLTTDSPGKVSVLYLA